MEGQKGGKGRIRRPIQNLNTSEASAIQKSRARIADFHRQCTQEIETWVEALARYDNNEFDEALAAFDKISDTSKILFNIGVIHATLGEHEKAVRIPAPIFPLASPDPKPVC